MNEKMTYEKVSEIVKRQSTDDKFGKTESVNQRVNSHG